MCSFFVCLFVLISTGLTCVCLHAGTVCITTYEAACVVRVGLSVSTQRPPKNYPEQRGQHLFVCLCRANKAI